MSNYEYEHWSEADTERYLASADLERKRRKESPAVTTCRCGGAAKGNVHFDRSLCPCGSMHYYCNDCGCPEDCDFSPASLHGDPGDECDCPQCQGGEAA